MKIKKAIITAAGSGTRMRPWTRVVSKELLPIINKPFIEYVIEDVISGGIKDIYIVINRGELLIPKYFQNYPKAKITFVEQSYAYGTLGAVLSVKEQLYGENVLVYWGDELILCNPTRTKQLLVAFLKVGKPIWGGVNLLDPYYIDKLAYVTGTPMGNLLKVKRIIEKPKKVLKNSIACMGGGIVTTEMWSLFDKEESGYNHKKGELILTNALTRLAKKEELYVLSLEGIYLSVGTPSDYHKTFNHLANEVID